MMVAWLIAAAAQDSKTVELKVKDITLTIPATWKSEKPASSMRLAQARIPAAKDDKEDAELTVITLQSAQIAANVKRWINQFQPEGRAVKHTKGKSKLGDYVFVELSGTYNKPVGPPVQGKTEAMAGARVLAVILDAGDKGVYFLKMAGLDKTVAEQRAALRASFGGDAAKEEELKLEE